MELEQFLLGWFGSSSLLALIELVLASDIMEFGYNRAPYIHYPCAIVAWAALLIFFFGHVKATIALTKILGDDSSWIVSQNIVERSGPPPNRKTSEPKLGGFQNQRVAAFLRRPFLATGGL